jgi:hypothetical protein
MSEMTMYLGQVFGLYLIITAVLVFTRRRQLIPVMGMFGKETFDRLTIAIVEVLAGLFFVLGYQEWGSFYEGVISVFAWLVLLEGLLWLFLSDKATTAIVKLFNNKTWYTLGGLLSLGFGIYLAGTGFGLL